MEDYMEAEKALALEDRILNIRNLSIANPLAKKDAQNRAKTLAELEKEFRSYFETPVLRDDWGSVAGFERSTTIKKRKKPLDISHLKLIQGGSSGV